MPVWIRSCAYNLLFADYSQFREYYSSDINKFSTELRQRALDAARQTYNSEQLRENINADTNEKQQLSIMWIKGDYVDRDIFAKFTINYTKIL